MKVVHTAYYILSLVVEQLVAACWPSSTLDKRLESSALEVWKPSTARSDSGDKSSAPLEVFQDFFQHASLTAQG